MDLHDHFADLGSFLARDKDLALDGDTNLHKTYIDELLTHDNIPMPTLINLDSALANLQKQGAIKLAEIYAFVQIARFFEGLKIRFKEGKLASWVNEIEIVSELKELAKNYDHSGELLESASAELARAKREIESKKREIRSEVAKLTSSSKLAPYLVDRQVHYTNGYETLLVRGGFNHALAGKVIDRTPAGFFYVAPRILSDLAQKIEDLEALSANIIAQIERDFSSRLFMQTRFLRFLNASFDRFDHYQARVAFARAKNFEFIAPAADQRIILKSFAHPALKGAVRTDLDFSKQILLITGVNAGGKTMLLKGILSASVMAKMLVPFEIDAKNSRIARFKQITALIADPQSAKNDISTFAGRMRQFSELFGKENALVGVDEIELGTDSDEAASLFKAMLISLKDKNQKIVITTHHKRLASLMAKYDFVELLAALYDEKLEKPTYRFLQGTIGKSYAFETALRYGVPKTVVNDAQKIHGDDKEKLNDLIERSSSLEMELKREIDSAKDEKEKLIRQNRELTDKKFELEENYRALRGKLEKEYKEAIELAKEAAKSASQSEIHKALNKANEAKAKVEIATPKPAKDDALKVGDVVKYLGVNALIRGIKKQNAQLECEGKIIYAPLFMLKKSAVQEAIKTPAPKVVITRDSTASVKLDLHGLRVDEALEKLDLFLSDALIAGFDEVLVYHGIGAGILARAVKDALREHPRVISFADAPPNMGGFGATLIRL